MRESPPRAAGGTLQRDRERARRVLAGRVDGLPTVCSKTVRVFISSTFQDMVVERNVLMERVYPRLKDFCKHYGLEFQVVDMRWGVREEAQDDHMTAALCMKEIHKCQRISVGPTFVIMFGEKYGYRPFPACIGAEEFEMLHGALLQAGRDVSLLQQWFRKDENRDPPEYSLVPISSRLPDFINKENADLQKAARDAWWKVFEELAGLLREAADICCQDGEMRKEDREKYFISVTEDEIRHGTILDHIHSRQVVFARRISDMKDNLSHPYASKFIDLQPDGAVNEKAQVLLRRFRDETIPAEVAEEYRRSYSVEWSANGGINVHDHAEYLRRLCDDFYNLIKKQTIQNLVQQTDLQHNPLVIEVLQHLQLCNVRSKGFQGRAVLLERIQRYVSRRDEVGVQREPFVVYGDSGSGKTSLMAVAVTHMLSWLPDDTDPVIILRFLGTTPKSSGIFTTLQSVCQQIAENYKVPFEDIQEDFQELTSRFWELLKCATKERPLVLLLDSLDQLSQNHQPFRLSWMPIDLPQHVKIVVSTLPEDQGILGRLKDWISNPDNFTEVPPLGNRLSMDLIKSWLKRSNQTLTPDQYVVVQRAFKNCSLPLYTKLVFEEVIRWKSYTHPDLTVLELTVKGIINQMMRRIEVQHGILLVSRGLAYLTAARNGLSEVELEDVLSLDDDVLDEIFTFWVPPIRRIPPLLWTRIRDDISSYLVEREADGVTVLSWHHRQFQEVMRDRYLKKPEDVISIHSSLADYYLGRWSRGRKKPFRYSALLAKQLKRAPDSEADRKISPQPLKWKTKTAQGVKVEYNLRKLSELPYHLYMAERHTELLRQVFYNYKWLHTKLRATSLTDLLSDLALVHKAHKGHRLEMLAAALRVAGSSLKQIPNTLAAEIIGRLKNATQNRTKHTDDFQDQRFDKIDVHDIEMFLSQVQTEGQKHCSLLPTFQCFDAPIEALAFSLEGHRKIVTDMKFSQDSLSLFSVSLDGTVVAWDTKTGEAAHKISVLNAKPGRHTQLLYADGFMVLETYTVGSPLYVIEEKTGNVKSQFSEPRTGYVHNTQLRGHKALREGVFYDVTNGARLTQLDYLVGLSDFVVSEMTPNQRYVLVGEAQATTLLDVTTGEVCLSLPGEHPACATAITKNSTKAVVGFSSSCLVKVLNIDPSSEEFGAVLLSFDHQAAYPSRRTKADLQYCQEVSQLVLSHDNRFVVMNINHNSLFVLGMECGKSASMELGCFEGNCRIHECGFAIDNITVIAIVGRHLCLWNAYRGTILAQMPLSSDCEDEFHMAVASSHGLLATVNKREPVIKLWDIGKLQEPQAPNVHTYNNPLSVVVVATQQKLAFIKIFHPLTSKKGHHYRDFFGLDVWNLATNHHQNYLPFGNYGSLVHIEVSVDGRFLVLLTEVSLVGHVFVIDIKSGDIVMKGSHKLCYGAQLSPSGQHLLMESSMGKEGAEVMVWETSGAHIKAFDKAQAAIFSSDSACVVCLKGKTLTKYCLETKTKVSNKFTLFQAERLQAIPNRPDVMVVTGSAFTGGSKGHKEAVVWDLLTGVVRCRLEGIAPSGLIDLAKNGEIGVDGWLQVYDLGTGTCLLRCADKGAAVEPDLEKSTIRITYDGRYVLWADTQPTHCIKVFQVDGQKLVAEVSTHAKVLSLSLTDFGYSVITGCEDGRILNFSLHTSNGILDEDDDDDVVNIEDDLDMDLDDQEEDEEDGVFNNNIVTLDKRSSRSNCSLDRIDRISTSGEKLPQKVIEHFDVMYQKAPEKTADSDLPVASESVKDELEANARFAREVRVNAVCGQEPRRRHSPMCCVL